MPSQLSSEKETNPNLERAWKWQLLEEGTKLLTKRGEKGGKYQAIVEILALAF